ncbi:hypothetical protein Moror_16115 [Moniliophthora roreri MCA 2997]|uniref:Uncharacterized protein n=2 Tax=Moniliophthora roreri TaxID=221103 RepID=V2X9H0_MONRO|nr:hypothetical protein Moror_16115 [Moniliophthora roreri MCA 2997]
MTILYNEQALEWFCYHSAIIQEWRHAHSSLPRPSNCSSSTRVSAHFERFVAGSFWTSTLIIIVLSSSCLLHRARFKSSTMNHPSSGLKAPRPYRPLTTPNRAWEVQKLLRTTVSLPSRNTIAKYLIDAELDMKLYEAELNRYKAEILALENRWSSLRKLSERCRGLLAPIHRMPPEILTAIFTHCCECNELTAKVPPPAIVLSMVCGQWRELLLSTPHLWASMNLHILEGQDHSKLRPLTELFMTRSSSQPLRLYMTVDLHVPAAIVSSALEELIKTSSRWQSLRLSLNTSVAQEYGLETIRGKLPLLESLHLDAIRIWDDPDDATFDLFEDCPSLNSVVLDGPDRFYERIVLPFHRLQSFTYGYGNARAALSRMSLCDNLRDAELSCVGELPHHEGQIVNETVRNLTVVACLSHDVPAVYKHLTLPHLSSMQLQGISSEEPQQGFRWQENPLVDFFIRSSCTLTSLTLKWLRITDYQVIAVLQLLPTLESLTIEECHDSRYPQYGSSLTAIVTPALLNSLSIDPFPSNPHILPHLADLSLTAHLDSLDQAALLNVVASRWLPDPDFSRELGVTCLQSFTLGLIGKDSDYSSFGSLEFFRGVGLRTVVSHIRKS